MKWYAFSTEDSEERLLKDFDDKSGHKSINSNRNAWVKCASKVGLVSNVLNGVIAVTATVLLVTFLSRSNILREQRNGEPITVDSQDGSIITPTHEEGHWIGCGESVEEARALGCHYDLMLAVWVPHDCFNATTSQRFLEQGGYTWYRDEALTETVSTAEAKLGDYKVIWSTIRYHLDHCAYVWTLQMESYTSKGPVIKGIYDMVHTEHCVNITVEQVVPGKTVSSLHPGFEKCGRP